MSYSPDNSDKPEPQDEAHTPDHRTAKRIGLGGAIVVLVGAVTFAADSMSLLDRLFNSDDPIEVQQATTEDPIPAEATRTSNPSITSDANSTDDAPADSTSTPPSASRLEPPRSTSTTGEDLSRVKIEIEHGSNGRGYPLGGDLYALGTKSELDLDIAWEVFDSNGDQLTRGSTCQIVVRLRGPGEDQDRRFGECEGITRATFDGWPGAIDIAGEWTVSVEDEHSGVSGEAQIEVRSSR